MGLGTDLRVNCNASGLALALNEPSPSTHFTKPLTLAEVWLESLSWFGSVSLLRSSASPHRGSWYMVRGISQSKGTG